MKKICLILIISFLAFGLPLTTQAKSPKNWENTVVSNTAQRGGTIVDIAYGQGKFGVLYYDDLDGNADIFFNTLSKSGEKNSGDIRITSTPADSNDPNIVWNGKDFGIIYRESWMIYYTRVSTKGEILMDPVEIDVGVHPSIVWNEKTQEYGLTWWGNAGNGSIPGAVFVRLDKEGNKLSPIISLNSVIDGGYYRPMIATNGEEYGISWEGNRGCGANYGQCPEPIFTVVSAAGEKLIPDTRLTYTGVERATSMVWNGSEYAIVTFGNSGISLLRVNNTASVLSFSQLPGNFTQAHTRFMNLLWDTDHYDMSFADCPTCNNPVDANIFITKYDRFGNSLSDFVKISEGIDDDYWPSKPIMAGGAVAIVWNSNIGDPIQNITFAQTNNF